MVDRRCEMRRSLMRDIDRVFELRKNMIDDWKYRGLDWRAIRDKYRVSKRWFYKLRARFLLQGYEGLRDRVRKNDNRPYRVSWQQKLKILDYVYHNPTHGPARIANEDPSIGVSRITIWKVLKQEGLNTRMKRRLWAESQGRPILTKKEHQILLAKKRHIHSSYAGELISVDTFNVSVKDLGKIWQYTACDTYSSYGYARVYHEKTSDSSIDFVDYLINSSREGKIKRVLTDQGTEFYNARFPQTESAFTIALRSHSIRHSVTKVAHPWTNGYAERLNQTIWQEFYLGRLDKRYASLEELNKDLFNFMVYYNFRRAHSGYKLVAEGYKRPGQAFFDTRERQKVIELKY
jgi:transposase InsO family protein